MMPDPEGVLDVWGGVECTVNRVGSRYFDQLELSGHAARLDDLDRFAELGLRTLRYPVLWERVSPDGQARNWAWTDSRLARLAELGIEPITGLIHHGSGPPDTSLLDVAFPEKLAQYARSVAERYPDLIDYVPVNEPLTTARFSCLYGHWYPHERNDRAFVQALLNQCRAVVLAMREIRRVNPDARLVQTEDMGFTRSTKRVGYQAAFENERRFLSLDLLTGKLDTFHPLHAYLRAAGAPERDLAWFLENPCPPDIVGINYYVTSERFLDDRVDLYPGHLVGGNGRDRYADVEAVRVCRDGLVGPRAILEQVWRRYRLPIAVTEAHLGCSPEQQVRWLLYVYGEAKAARLAGADVRAVTAWALLGSHGWSNLVTTDPVDYESGVFRLRDGQMEDTPLVPVVSALCRGAHARRDRGSGGWWTLPTRLLHPPHPSLLEEADGPASGRAA